MIARTRTPLAQAARLIAPRLTVAAAAAAVALVAACEQDRSVTDPDAAFSRGAASQQGTGTIYGAAVRMGQGTARTYVTAENGRVVEVGVALTEGALRGLPRAHHNHDDAHDHGAEFVLPMHPRNPTPYKHVGINWVPNGHPPVGIYTLPHFDFHFYMITEAERNAIDPSDPQWLKKARNLPSPEYIPANYVSTHVLAGVNPEEETFPRMGLHWIDVTSPELHGATFTSTFIYGSYDGKIIFGEPMITKAFLESKPNFRKELPAAAQGYNPGSYRIYWNEKTQEHRIALADLPEQR
jgi:hypothetical protein